jgi:hypothetical protein
LRRTVSRSTRVRAARLIGMAMRSSFEAALQAREVAVGVGQLAVEHRPDLVDRVGELVAAVLDVHDGLAVRDEAAVDVGETRISILKSSATEGPRPLPPARPGAREAQGLQLAVQGRALHADEGRGARDVAAEPQHLGVQVFALEHLARLAQRQGDDPLGAQAPGRLAGRRGLGGSMSAVIGSEVARGQDQHPLDVVAQLAHVARPGADLQHGEASSPSRRRGMPVASQMRSMK